LRNKVQKLANKELQEELTMKLANSTYYATAEFKKQVEIFD